jgi:hypothetical protein
MERVLQAGFDSLVLSDSLKPEGIARAWSAESSQVSLQNEELIDN